MNLVAKNLLSNNIYELNSIEDEESINNIIINIKDTLEDKWKSVNKINTSIVLPIRLSVDELTAKLQTLDFIKEKLDA